MEISFVHWQMKRLVEEQEEKDRKAASDCHHPTVPLVEFPIIHARLVNFNPTILLKEVKAQAYGKGFLRLNDGLKREGDFREICFDSRCCCTRE